MTENPEVDVTEEREPEAKDLAELLSLQAEHIKNLKKRHEELAGGEWRKKLDLIDLNKLEKMEADLIKLQKREQDQRRERLSGDPEVPIHKRADLKDAIHKAFTLPRTGLPSDAGAKWGEQLTAEHMYMTTPTTDEVIEQHKLYNDLLYIQMAAASHSAGRQVDPRSLPMWQPYSQAVHRAYAELLDTAESGGGTDWVPTMFSSQFLTAYRQRGAVAQLFRRFPMTSKTWELPCVSAVSTATAIAETTAAHTAQITGTPSSGTTANVTFTAWKMGQLMAMSGEWVEDANPDVLMYARDEIAQSYADGEARAIINGDTSTTHQDTDTNLLSATTTVERKVIGLRRRALADSKTVNGGGNDMTDDDIINARGTLGNYGIKAEECAVITSARGQTDLMLDADLKLVYAFGPRATNVTGAVMEINGMPVVVSSHMRSDLNNAGVNGSSGNTFTGALVFNRTMSFIGDRRAVTIEPVRNAFYDTNWLVLMGRWDFQHRTTATSCLVYNIPNS